MLNTLISRCPAGMGQIKMTVNLTKYLKCSRKFSSDSSAYGGDGKTTVKVINDDEPNIHFVNTYSNKGFRLSNGLFVHGSMILFPTNVFAWRVRKSAEINLDSLLLFDLIVPKVKIVVIGYGSQGDPYDASIPIRLKKKGISCEMLATPNAVTTYNYLAHDSVHVAGAFVPVRHEVDMKIRDVEGLHASDNFNQDFDMLPDVELREIVGEEKELFYKTVKRKERPKKQFDD